VSAMSYPERPRQLGHWRSFDASTKPGTLEHFVQTCLSASLLTTSLYNGALVVTLWTYYGAIQIVVFIIIIIIIIIITVKQLCYL